MLYFRCTTYWFNIFFSFCSFCCFLGCSLGIWRFPGQGLNRSCSHRPTPEPQQRGIRAASATYTTAHGNAGSLTHWARPGIELSTSWFLVRFINHCAMTGTPITAIFLLGVFSSFSIDRMQAFSHESFPLRRKPEVIILRQLLIHLHRFHG